MAYITLKVLKAEATEWAVRMANELGAAFDYDVALPAFSNSSFMNTLLPEALNFVREGVWIHGSAIDLSVYETISTISASRDGDVRLYPYLYQLNQTLHDRQTLADGDDLTMAGIARLAGISVRTIRNLSSRKELQVIKHGGGSYISAAEAERWLATRESYRPTTYISNISSVLV